MRYDEGIHVGYRWYDAVGQKPLFAFGHGLSYARFHFSKLRVDVGSDGSVRVGAGEEHGAPARLYDRPAVPPASSCRERAPPRQLKGYAKVELGPGQTTDVKFRLERDDLAYFDERTSSWVVAEGRYTASVGGSSRDLHVHRTFHVDGSG